MEKAGSTASRCSICFFRRMTFVTDWREAAQTCLHPLARTPVGRAMSCAQAREQGQFCGPDGLAWTPMTAPAPVSNYVFRQ
jgi:hypothetical protein